MPSKSARKREAHALQRLGMELMALREEEFAAMPLDEQLREAIEFGRTVRTHEARRRQLQLIGKLMRSADVDAIRKRFEAATAMRRREAALAHAAEDWRERMLADPDAPAAFMQAFGPLADGPELARLVEAARAETTPERRRRARRTLYRSLLATITLAVASSPATDPES